MELLRHTILAVTAAALICGILSGLVQNGAAKELIKLLAGLFMTVTLLGPLLKLDLSKFDWDLQSYIQEGESQAAQGQAIAEEAKRSIIKAEAEAYILDKAAALDAELTVEVTLGQGEDPAPQGAVLYGTVSPYARRQLEQVMATDLGIPLEEQRWTG